MSIFDRFKKREESINSLQSKYSKTGKAIERQELQNALKEREKELSRLKHPQQQEAKKSITKAGSRIVDFAGGLAKEGARSYAKTSRTLKTKRLRALKSQPRRSFVAPTGDDISLSSSIARADWSGERNIMNTDFFGSGEMKDLMGEKEKKDINLISNTKKNEKKYY